MGCTVIMTVALGHVLSISTQIVIPDLHSQLPTNLDPNMVTINKNHNLPSHGLTLHFRRMLEDKVEKRYLKFYATRSL